VRRAVVIAALLWASPAAAEEWTSVDTAVQAAVTLTLAVDYLQTRAIIDDGIEANPVMGNRGERLPAEVYFPVVAVAHAGLARLLPQPYRRMSQVALIGLQSYIVHRNLSYGYIISF
jgi:hypothetical protein